MLSAPYDDPINLFREYSKEECDEDGYPFVWPAISERMRRDAGYRCSDCGFQYLATGDRLTVHHICGNKADCRRLSLSVMCWPCHLQDHSPAPRPNFSGLKCPRCGHRACDWSSLKRHIQGIHKAGGWQDIPYIEPDNEDPAGKTI